MSYKLAILSQPFFELIYLIFLGFCGRRVWFLLTACRKVTCTADSDSTRNDTSIFHETQLT